MFDSHGWKNMVSDLIWVRNIPKKKISNENKTDDNIIKRYQSKVCPRN